jgi:hypothetical protein
MAQRMEQGQRVPFREVKPVKWYSDLTDLRQIVRNRPVLLLCDTAFDREYNDFDQEWAVFFLRHVNLKIPVYYGYLGGFDIFMQRAKATNEPAAFVLVNGPVEGAVWKNERFSLLKLGTQAKLVGVQGANAFNRVNGRPFVWLGRNTVRLLIVSNNAQTVNFAAWPTGPSRPEEKHRQILISIGDNAWPVDVSESLSIDVSLKPGLNYLDIRYQDSSTVAAQQFKDDPGTLPLGLWDYRISNRDEVSN